MAVMGGHTNLIGFFSLIQIYLTVETITNEPC